MKIENKKLQEQAEYAKIKLLAGAISHKEARELIAPYIEAINQTSIALAKEYGTKAKLVNIMGYMR